MRAEEGCVWATTLARCVLRDLQAQGLELALAQALLAMLQRLPMGGVLVCGGLSLSLCLCVVHVWLY